MNKKILLKRLKTLNACDNPPSKNNIDKLQNDKTLSEKTLNDPSIDIDPSIICKDFVQYVENILNETMIEEEESTKEEIDVSQDDGNKEVINNANEIPHTKENVSKDNNDEVEEFFF